MRKYLFLAVLTLALSPWAAFETAEAGLPYCSKTAKQMFGACRADVNDNFREARAKCLNIGDDEERGECFAEAWEERHEESDECFDQREARYEACDLLGEDRYDPDPLKDPAIMFVDPDDIGDTYEPNPYVNLTVGHTYVLRAGEDFEEIVVVTVTDEVREAEGYDPNPGDDDAPVVLCRTVVDAVVIEEIDEEDGTIDYEPVEITDDEFAQDVNGAVYYCGEVSRNFEDGYLVDIDGSFFSGIEGAKGGVLMRAVPAEGEADRQEWSIGEAEDVVEYVSLATSPDEENPLFPCNDQCLQTHDTDALSPGETEFKYYLEDVGFVLAVALEDGTPTGEREELLCVGDSLAVLADPDCGIDDLDELLDELCELSPDAFCEDDD